MRVIDFARIAVPQVLSVNSSHYFQILGHLALLDWVEVEVLEDMAK